MFDQLEIIENRYDQLTEPLSDPDVVSDPDKLRKYSKEQSEIQETVEVFSIYKEHLDTIEESKEMLTETDDSEMIEMLEEEIASSEDELPKLEERLRILIIPKDTNDNKNVIIEIHGAAGCDEAQFFAGV